jgi:hypothetical protein
MSQRDNHSLRTLAGLLLATAIVFAAGCSSGAQAPVPGALTAKAAYKIAQSTLSTTAPDGKLLVLQAVEPITATSSPTWDFLIGSPKTDVVYQVVVKDGKGESQQYGKAGLTSAQWGEVPADTAWKIDSDVAIANALSVYPNGKNAGYIPGFVTYIPKDAAEYKQVKQMTWIINFDPASQGNAPTSTVEVDLASGQAALAK